MPKYPHRSMKHKEQEEQRHKLKKEHQTSTNDEKCNSLRQRLIDINVLKFKQLYELVCKKYTACYRN